MKLKSLLLSLCAFAITVPYTAANDHEESEHTALEESMNTMNKSWRRVKRYASDPSRNAESLKYLEAVKAEAVAGIEMIPARKQDIPEKQQAKFMKGYVKEMEALVEMLSKLEAALTTGDNEGAVALVKKIDAHRKEGHKHYKRPDED